MSDGGDLPRLTLVISASAISASALLDLQALRSRPAAEDGTTLLLDVRSPRQFLRGHVPGSHSIAAARLVSTELPDGDLILITEQPQQAIALIEQLHLRGYCRQIQYLDGGYVSFERQGLGLEAVEPVRRCSDASLIMAMSRLLAAAGRAGLAPVLLALRLLLRPRLQTRARA